MEPILREVADYLRHRPGVDVIEDPLPGVCPLAVRTDGAVAFFRTTHAAGLRDDWRATQTRIAAVPPDSYPHDRFYLALLVVDSGLAEPDWELITRDLHVCRKVIVPTEAYDTPTWLEDLPFLPLPDQAVNPRSVITPGHALYDAGFRPELADRLLNQTPAATLARQFREGRVLRQPDDAPPAHMLLAPRGRYRRLKRLAVENFRPFASRLQLPEEGELGDLTVIFGPNGSGKTSMAQAIEWAVTGEAFALEDDHADIRAAGPESPYVNVYHKDRPAQVELLFQEEGSAREFTFRRSVDRYSRTLWQGRPARNQSQNLMEVLDADLPVVPNIRVLRTMTRQSHFLDQETIQEFLSRSAADRYAALANMIGTVDFLRAGKKLGQVRDDEERELQSARAQVQEARSRAEVEQQVLAGLRQQLAETDSALHNAVDVDGLVAELQQEVTDLSLPIQGAPPDRATLVAFAQSMRSGLGQLRAGLVERVKQLVAAADEGKSAQAAFRVAAGLEAELVQVRATKAETDTALGLATDVYNGALQRLREAETAARQCSQTQAEAGDRLARARRLAEAADRLSQARASEEAAREAAKQAATAAEQERSQTAAKGSLVDALAARVAAWRSRQVALEALRADVPELQRAQASLRAATERRDRLESQRQQLFDRRTSATQAALEAEAQLNRLTSEFKPQQDRVEIRQALLGAMLQYLEGDRCPLCSHKWESAEALYRQAQQAIQESPDALREGQAAIAEATQAFDAAKAAVADAKLRLAAVEDHLAAAIQEGNHAQNRVRSWVERATEAGLSVPSDLKDSEALIAEALRLQEATDPSATHRKADAELDRQRRDLEAAVLRHEAADEALVEAVALRMQAEESYREADMAAPSDLRRPTPGAEELDRCERHSREAGDAVLAAENALRVARNEVTAATDALDDAQARDRTESDREATLTHALQTNRATFTAYRQRLAALNVDAISPDEELEQARIRLRRLESLEQKAQWLDGAAQVRALQETVAAAEERLAAALAVQTEAEGPESQHAHALERIDRAARALDQARVEEQNARLTYFEPTINEIYHRINPHPFFPHLRWQPSVASSELTMHATTREGQMRVPVQQYFSMAQANVVALSVFLGSALLQNWSGLRLICIDDPIQQMDDLNTVAFLDVLHAIIERKRQVVLTTANREFYQLLLRRYAYLNRHGSPRFRAFRLRTVNPKDGPDMVEDTPVFQENGRVRLGAVQ